MHNLYDAMVDGLYNKVKVESVYIISLTLSLVHIHSDGLRWYTQVHICSLEMCVLFGLYGQF